MLAAYAIAHAVVDFSCAFLMMLLPGDAPLVFLIYNFCAFALQMPLGLLVRQHGRLFAVAGCFLVCLALFCTAQPLLAAICAGIGNAMFHIGGGAEVLARSERMGPLGIFVSPGAIGLYLGRICAGWTPILPQLALLAAVVLLLLTPVSADHRSAVSSGNIHIGLPVVSLTTVVVLRSFLGCSAVMSGAAALPWLVPVMAAGGKALGGILADRLGAKWVCTASLLGAALLFPLAAQPAAALLATLLFNMTMPITLGAAARYLPPVFGFGLLTFGLFLGYLPSFWGVSVSPLIAGALCLLSLPLLIPAWKERSHGTIADVVTAADAAD